MIPKASIGDVLVLALALYTTTAHAQNIPLSLFVPKSTGLTDACNKIYTTPVEGCTTADFNPTPNCSTACVSGLAAIQFSILKNCAADAQNNNNLVGAFLSNQGISSVCGGSVPAPSSNAPSSNTPSSMPPPSTPAQESTTTPMASSASSVPPSSSAKPHTTMTPSTTNSLTSTVAPSSSSSTPSSLTTTSPTTLPSSAVSTSTPIVAASSDATTSTSSTAASSTTNSMSQAQASQKAAALCEKGDSSGHGGSLLDTQCASGAMSIFAGASQGLRTWAFLLVLGSIGWAGLVV